MHKRLYPISERRIGEKCGIFGVYGVGKETARIVYFGLWALQHRGQESSGIASSDQQKIKVVKGAGLVAHVFKEKDFNFLEGDMAIGHNRYSTSMGTGYEHAQPVLSSKGLLTLAHNGNLPSTRLLESFLSDTGIETKNLNDSEMMHAALEHWLKKGIDIEDAVKNCLPLFTGAFSLLLMTKDKMVAVRDCCGIRPLSVGKLNGGYVFSSETCALDAVTATFLREVLPGEMVVADRRGLTSCMLADSQQKLDIFEFVYFARPDSQILGQRVGVVRKNFGRELALENPINADVVIPVPDSALPAASGYAETLSIHYEPACFVKNRYIHRTFIEPGEKLREIDVDIKLNVIPEFVEGKRVVLVDDSIVRGTTSQAIVAKIRRAGAKEVHFLVSSPPVKFPDFYGIDTREQNTLIASKMPVDGIARFIGADSLYYLSYRGMIKATGLPEEVFCASCFTGEYPIDIEEHTNEVSYNFERASDRFVTIPLYGQKGLLPSG